MRITLLGTGTGLIRKERRSPSVLIETSSGDSIIVDCGWGVPDAVNKVNFPLNHLSHLAISHRHADHMSALTSLLQSQLIANIPHLPGEPHRDKLIVHGYPGIREDLKILCNMMIPELDVKQAVTVIEHGGERHRFNELIVSAVLVHHVETMPAVSFCFETEGKKVVVTGDLGWDEGVLPQLQAADIVVMDASASQQEYQEQPVRSHLAPIQCGELAARASVKHLVLTSLYDREPKEKIISAVRQHYQGPLTIPNDLQVLEI